MATGKNIALTRQNFVGKIMSLLFNLLSRLVIFFSSKEQTSFNFTAGVTIYSDFGPKKIKYVTSSFVSSSICQEFVGPDAMIFVF